MLQTMRNSLQNRVAGIGACGGFRVGPIRGKIFIVAVCRAVDPKSFSESSLFCLEYCAPETQLQTEEEIEELRVD